MQSFGVGKKNCQKVAFWSYLNKHIFGLEFKIFCLHLKIHMLMSWRPTSNNSYRPFNNSRLMVYLNLQRGIWKWLIKIIEYFVLLIFNSLSVMYRIFILQIISIQNTFIFALYYLLLILLDFTGFTRLKIGRIQEDSKETKWMWKISQETIEST